MEKHYNVSEIFGNTIQGEGRHAGYPVVFFRAAQCNLWPSPGRPSATCPWCDTKQLHSSTPMTLPDIVDAVVKAAHPHDTNKIGLVISGGEPLLQLDEDMLTALSPLFDFIDIETNGTVRPKFDVLAWSMRTFISCSPKTGDIVLSVNDVDWYKLLVPAKEHLLPIIEERAALTDATIYLQPVEVGGPHSDISKHNLERTIALSLSTGHPVGLQLHKYIGVR